MARFLPWVALTLAAALGFLAYARWHLPPSVDSAAVQAHAENGSVLPKHNASRTRDGEGSTWTNSTINATATLERDGTAVEAALHCFLFFLVMALAAELCFLALSLVGR